MYTLWSLLGSRAWGTPHYHLFAKSVSISFSSVHQLCHHGLGSLVLCYIWKHWLIHFEEDSQWQWITIMKLLRYSVDPLLMWLTTPVFTYYIVKMAAVRKVYCIPQREGEYGLLNLADCSWAIQSQNVSKCMDIKIHTYSGPEKGICSVWGNVFVFVRRDKSKVLELCNEVCSGSIWVKATMWVDYGYRGPGEWIY